VLNEHPLIVEIEKPVVVADAGRGGPGVVSTEDIKLHQGRYKNTVS